MMLFVVKPYIVLDDIVVVQPWHCSCKQSTSQKKKKRRWIKKKKKEKDKREREEKEKEKKWDAIDKLSLVIKFNR